MRRQRHPEDKSKCRQLSTQSCFCEFLTEVYVCISISPLRQRRAASAAPAVDQVPTTTRRSARIHGSPPPEPDTQPGPRGALPEEKPTEKGSEGRETTKLPSPVGVGNLPKKKSEGQKSVRKSSDAETVDQAKNGDDDDDEEAPDSAVGTKVSAVNPTEERGTVRGTVTRGQGGRGPPPQRSKKPTARRTRGGGTCTSSDDPTEHHATDTQTREEARQEAGEAEGEDTEPLVLKEAPSDLTPDPSSTADTAVKIPHLSLHLLLLLSFFDIEVR